VRRQVVEIEDRFGEVRRDAADGGLDEGSGRYVAVLREHDGRFDVETQGTLLHVHVEDGCTMDIGV
jgi:hypothetical protein